MNDKKCILIVDDAPQDIQLLLEYLKDDYAVLVAKNGEKAIEIATTLPTPDVVLMDVSMPGMDGYKTCRKLKDAPYFDDINIIFVSANNSTNEILEGYEAGGSDYIIKPVNPDELLQKIKLSIKNRQARKTLKEEKSRINNAFMTSITSSGELGDILQFFRDCYSVTSIDELGELITGKLLINSSLFSTVQLRDSTSIKNYSSDGILHPLETELLDRLKDSRRIISQGNRLIINYGNVSTLIKNMPVENSGLCGRIRDNLAIMIEGANSRLISLQLIQQQRNTSNNIMANVISNLEASFISLGLTDNQEKLILDIVENGIKMAISDIAYNSQHEEGLHD